MNEVTRPVLRYFGGKWQLAPWVIENMPPHRIYVEPFGGGASILLQKPRSYAEIYNDINSEIVNIFRILRDEKTAAELSKILKITPWARDEFLLSYEKCDDPVEQARRTICRAFMGHGATGAYRDGKTGFRAKMYTGNKHSAATFSEYFDHIETFTKRLSGVVIENRNALELFDQHDSPDTLWLLDPPYVLDTRTEKHGYKYELTNEDHQELCNRIKSLSGMVMLCGYPNSIYDALGWEKRETTAKTDGNATRTEVLWLNPKCISAQSQQTLFGGSK